MASETKLLSPERVKEITERVEKAPRGSWIAFPKPKYQEWHVGLRADNSSCFIALCPEGVPGDDMAEKEHLATFIAASRTDIPDLLTERELLVGIVGKYGKHLPDCNTMLPYGCATQRPCTCGLSEVVSLLKEQG